MVEMKTYKTRGEWLAARVSTIGGSEASSIVGMNPYQTNVELWELKTGRRKANDISDVSYVRYGTEAEQYLRNLYALDFPETTVCYEEGNMWTNSDYPWAHASLDGWLIESDGRKGILEIKTTNILQSMQKEKWNDRIPDNYYVQLLHYFMVTGFDFAVLKAQLRRDYGNNVILTTKHYRIEKQDVEEDIDYLIKRERAFMAYIKADKQPPLELPDI